MEIAYKKKAPCEHVIVLSKTKSNVMDFVRKFNHGKDLRDKERLKPALQETLHRIIYLLAKQYVSPTANWFLQKKNINGTYLTDKDLALPHAKSYIANFNQQQGCEFKIVSVNTVRNHIQKLINFGLIKQVKSNSKTLLLVHPELLKFTPNFDHLNDHLNVFFGYPLKNLHNVNSAIQENKIQTLDTMYPNLETLNSITVSDVNNSNIKEASNHNLENSYLDTQQAETKKGVDEKKKEKIAPKRKSLRDQYIQKTVIMLWLWVLENLLSNYSFVADSQKEIAIEYFTNEFQNTSKTAYQVHADLLERLEDWKKFVLSEKNNKKKGFTPLPGRFFDPSNPHGFEKTKLWKHKKENKARKNKAVAKAKNHFRKYVRVTEDTNLSYKEKMDKIRGLEHSMNRLQHKHPYVHKLYVHLVNEYTNQSTSKVA